MDYQLLDVGVLRLTDNASIPPVAGNRDWQDYQTWVTAGNTPRPKQPGPTYIWNGSAWIEDPTLKQSATNRQAQADLNSTDAAAIRSIRSILTQEARISKWTAAPLTQDQQYLLDSETNATTLRNKIQPPAAPTLAQAKLDRIAQLRQQGAAYIQLGFIAQTFTWGSKTTFDILYMTLAGYQPAGNLLTVDSKVHLWDANGVERILTPLNAGKLAGALYQWMYLAQREFQKAVNDVNALTTVAAVQAYTWTTIYSSGSKFNADTYVPSALEEQTEGYGGPVPVIW